MKRLEILIISLLFSIINIFAQHDGWNISTEDNTNYTGVSLANGRIGLSPSEKPFVVNDIVLNNVYDKGSYVRAMNFANIEVEIDGEKITEANISNWKQTLNMKEAGLTTSFKFRDKASISYTIYALRNVPYTGYIDVEIDAYKTIEAKVVGKILTPSNFKNAEGTFKILKDDVTTIPILQTVAKSSTEGLTVASSAAFIWHNIDSSLKAQRPELVHDKISDYDNRLSFKKIIKKGTSLKFAWTGAECTTKNFTYPKSESERFVIFNFLNQKDVLLGQHKALWEELWEGDIVIEGDLQAQQDVRLALYHLYSFSRGDSDLSIAPMGLSSRAWGGHIFWDAEIWMFPPLLVLNQEIARSMVNYRSDRLTVAKRRAVSYGYKGAMFPWESDDTGEEVCPTGALTGTFEHHITADIAIAFWNYYQVTDDKKWLKEKGFPLMKEVADFWVSRSTKNPDGSYSINNVVGSDEWAMNIDDNTFTNGSAITALDFAAKAASVTGNKINPQWIEVAQKLRLLKFENGVTREHRTYNGEIIKQADANLLAYPLKVITNPKQIKKDLEYYEPKLDPRGPAMGHSIMAILHAKLGDGERAYELFKRSYIPNKRAPFGALVEGPKSKNPFFVTAAGGMLQAVMFGFGGLEITNKGVIQKNPVLPKEWKKLTIKGVGQDKRTFVVD